MNLVSTVQAMQMMRHTSQAHVVRRNVANILKDEFMNYSLAGMLVSLNMLVSRPSWIANSTYVSRIGHEYA